MKQEFMRIADAANEADFYSRYPTEEAFFMKHGGAIKKLMAKGGEAYPQTATMDNFFSYGVPVPPTYYRQGGAFPMAQPENQFFSPFYGNVPNPYNKAMGGSSEAYPQSMSFPYGNTGRSTHFMMQDGGDMPEDQTIPKMGVNGKLLEFVGTIKNTAANKLNSNLATYGKVKNPEQYEFEQARYGGNLKGYQSKDTPGGINNYNYKFNKGNLFEKRDLPQIDYNSDKGTVTNNYYYGPGNEPSGDFTNCFPGDPNCNQGNRQLPPEYTNDVDYLYGRRRPYSDFNIKGKGMAGNYRSTGWLKDEYGMEKLREMGLTGFDQTKGGLFRRPTQRYYFGDSGKGSAPGQVDAQGMPVANTGPGSDSSNNVQTMNGSNRSQQGSPNDMGLLARMFNRQGNMVPNPANITKDYKDSNPERNTIVDTNNPAGWNPYMSDFRNQIVQNRRRRTFDKLNDLSAHETWQKDMLGKAYENMPDKPTGVTKEQYSDIGLQGWRGRKEQRLLNRAMNLDRKVNAQRFQGKETSSEKKSRREQRESAPSSYQQYRKPMTLEEYNAKKEIEARDKAAVEKQIRDSNVPSSEMPPVQPVVESNEPKAPTTMTEDVYTNTPASFVGTTSMPYSSNSKRSFYPADKDMSDGYDYGTSALPVPFSSGAPMYEIPLERNLEYDNNPGYQVPVNPSNFDPNDPQQRAAMMKAIIDGATDDSYDDILPGDKNKKYGGSYNTGDVVDMTPEEIQRFIQMGGQIEFLD
jgi:hypothetical protein